VLNPCLECNHHLYGGDKNSKLCATCNDRILYNHFLSGEPIAPECPMPVLSKPQPKPDTKYPKNTTRTCNKCGKVKPLDGFRRNAKSLYGRDTVCSDCRNTAARERYARGGVKVAEAKAQTKQTVEAPPFELMPQTEWLERRCLDLSMAIYSHLKECDDCYHPLESWALELARTLKARNDIMQAAE
jgi:hypothetical protein